MHCSVADQFVSDVWRSASTGLATRRMRFCIRRACPAPQPQIGTVLDDDLVFSQGLVVQSSRRHGRKPYGTGSTIEDQITLCRKHAGQQNLTVIATFEDRARSGGSVFGRDGLLGIKLELDDRGNVECSERRSFYIASPSSLPFLSCATIY